ncbi:MAG TPA: hypothetical protein PLG17_03820 [Thermodesulfobacteriota bacterium]|nr:hypothetical protein [Thermodesulfobacteriota bacterium]
MQIRVEEALQQAKECGGCRFSFVCLVSQMRNPDCAIVKDSDKTRSYRMAVSRSEKKIQTRIALQHAAKWHQSNSN